MNADLLVYQAKSFYNAYIALDQLSRDDSDALLLLFAPLIVNGAFSTELTLKAILAKNKIEYGKEHNLPFTAGSDQHTTHMIGGGMVFPRKLKDVHDFTRAVLGREAVELLDGCKSE